MPKASVMQETSLGLVDHVRRTCRALREPLRGLKIGVMPFGTLGHDVGRRQDLLDRRPELLVLLRSTVARSSPSLAPGSALQQLPVGLELLRGLGIAHPVADIGLAVDAAVGDVGRAGPHLGRASRCWPFSSTMNLLCWMALVLASRRNTLACGRPTFLIMARFSARGKASCTLPFLSLGSLFLASTITRTSTPRSTRFLQRLGDGLVAELVEAAEQRVARCGVGDELQDGVVELAAQPLLRLRLLGALELVWASCCRTRAYRPGCWRRRD